MEKNENEKMPVISLHIPLCAMRVKCKQFEGYLAQLKSQLEALNKERDTLVSKIAELDSVVRMLKATEAEFEKEDPVLSEMFYG